MVDGSDPVVAGPQAPDVVGVAALEPVPSDRELGPDLVERMTDYARAGRAPNTWRSYESDLRHFDAWCLSTGRLRFPAAPATVAAYLADHAGRLSVSTLRRRLSAISVLHQLADLPTPTAAGEVRAVWSGIRRTHGAAPRKARAVRTDVLEAMVAPLQDSLADHRDRAILLIGFSTALRRSEIVALDVEDLVEDSYGLRVGIGRSKTDQEALGAVRGIPYGTASATCPVAAWRAWRRAAGLTTGPAFRGVNRWGKVMPSRLSDRAVSLIVKRRAEAAGLEGDWSGHSLRAGFATEGYARGVPELAIMRHGRWRSPTVMRGYVEEGTVWQDNAAGRLGL